MLAKSYSASIFAADQTIEVSRDVSLYTRILTCEKNKPGTVLFLHGGALTGNHTLCERPARWLMERGFFSRIIMPDRRGAGGSSRFRRGLTLSDLALDMKNLLDRLKTESPVTAIAQSYSGPVALILAGMDLRIEEIFLIASSPELDLIPKPLNFLKESDFFLDMVRGTLLLTLGRRRSAFPDLDFIYDIHDSAGLIKAQYDILRNMDRNDYNNLSLMADSLFNRKNMSVPDYLSVNARITQIIGSRDAIWSKSLSEKQKKSFPNFRQILIPGAGHRDMFLRAEEFMRELAGVLSGNYVI